MHAQSQGELYNDYIIPLLATTICTLFGFTDLKPAVLKQWADHEVFAFSRPDVASSPETMDYFDTLIAQRRLERRQDLLSTLLLDVQKEDGKPLTLDELRGFCFLFLTASIEAPPLALGFTIIRALEESDLAHVIRTQPESIPKVIEETLRLFSPFPSLYRMTTVPKTLGGKHIPEGQLIIALPPTEMFFTQFLPV